MSEEDFSKRPLPNVPFMPQMLPSTGAGGGKKAEYLDTYNTGGRSTEQYFLYNTGTAYLGGTVLNKICIALAILHFIVFRHVPRQCVWYIRRCSYLIKLTLATHAKQCAE
jgi:hypothetical protein